MRVGDDLELIQPGDAGTAAPLRCRCRGIDLALRKTGRDPALEPLVAVIVGPPWIEPDLPEAVAAAAYEFITGPLLLDLPDREAAASSAGRQV